MNEDAVDRLEGLADLHRRGELTDDEFAQAKKSVLGAAQTASPEPTFTSSQPAAAPSSLRAQNRDPVTPPPSASRRPRLWRSPWLLGVVVFCGFMFGAVGTAAVPSSALWTGRIVCSNGYHLSHQSSDTSFGNTSQTSVSFRCVNAVGAAQSVSTFEIFLLQFVLGALVVYILVVSVGTLIALRR